MPYNTNWGNVVEMTEAQAKRLGKRHTSKEWKKSTTQSCGAPFI